MNEKLIGLKVFMDAMPFSVFVMDHELRIVDFNKAAERMTGEKPEITLKRFCGEILHCLHEKNSTKECGKTEHCKDCVIRNSVYFVRDNNQSIRKKTELLMEKDDEQDIIHALLTVSPVSTMEEAPVILTIQDITEFIEVKEITTICSNCKKIKIAKDNWDSIESYLLKNNGMKLSHGICPDCKMKFYSEYTDDGK